MKQRHRVCSDRMVDGPGGVRGECDLDAEEMNLGHSGWFIWPLCPAPGGGTICEPFASVYKQSCGLGREKQQF